MGRCVAIQIEFSFEKKLFHHIYLDYDLKRDQVWILNFVNDCLY